MAGVENELAVKGTWNSKGSISLLIVGTIALIPMSIKIAKHGSTFFNLPRKEKPILGGIPVIEFWKRRLRG